MKTLKRTSRDPFPGQRVRQVTHHRTDIPKTGSRDGKRRMESRTSRLKMNSQKPASPDNTWVELQVET